MIVNGAHFKKQSMPINIGAGDVVAKPSGEFCLKMGHTQYYSRKKEGNYIDKISFKGNSQKKSPGDTLSECNLNGHYNKCSCDTVSSERAHFGTDENFVEVKRASVYHSSKSQRKLWLEAIKELKGAGKVDSWSNFRKDNVSDGPSCSQWHGMYDIDELQDTIDDCLDTEESSNVHVKSMAKDKKLETENLIQNMSNLPHYLQRTERGESFQDRALRFGVLDWSLLEKWNSNKGGKGHRTSHSISGSDTFSSTSTLGSSSFSCRSDLSSSAKRERSPSNSLYSGCNPASVSSFNPQCLSPSSSPTMVQERYTSYVEGSRHGPKENSLNVQRKADCKVPCYDYLDSKHLQGKVMENQGSKVEAQKDICGPLAKEVTFSVHKDLDHARLSGTGVTNDGGVNGLKTEQDCYPVFELPKEQWISGLATPGFFSAGDRSPETCSEVSLNMENVSLQVSQNTMSSTVIQLTQAGISENEVNTQFVDSYDELPDRRSDGGNSQTGDSVSKVKSSTSVHYSSPQKVVPRISISTERDQNLIYLQNTTHNSQDTQKCILPKSSMCPIDNNPSKHSGDASNDVAFCRSQSALCNEMQPRHKVIDIPVTAAGAFPSQKQLDRKATNEIPIVVSRTYKNRRAKSFSLSGSRDPVTDDDESAFMTPKSFSVKPDTCSCHHGLSKDSCKVCKKASVSPLRRWIDPIVKSRERHQMDAPSRAPLYGKSLHHDHNADVVNSKSGIRRNISLRKSLAQGFSGGSHKTSRNSSVKSTSSDNQAHVELENNNSGNNFPHMSRSRCNSPGPKHQKVSEKLSHLLSENCSAQSSMHAPPANPPILQGLLHFVYKNGLPYFTFSLNESEEVLAAKTRKVDNSEGRDFDWMYSFHSIPNNKRRNKSGWVNWGRKDNYIPDLVGNMKVSSSLCSKLNGSGNIEHVVETEFVLFGAKTIDTKEDPTTKAEHTEISPSSPSQSVHSEVSSDTPLSNSLSASTSSTSMVGDGLESALHRSMVPPKHPYRKNEMHVLRYPFKLNSSEASQSSSTRSKFSARNDNRTICREPDMADSDMFLSIPFYSHLELAALVTRVPLESRESVKSVQGEDAPSKKFGGWGIKFLSKISGGSNSERNLDNPMNFTPAELNDDGHFHFQKSSNFSVEFSDISVVNTLLNSERCSFEYGPLEISDISSNFGAQGHPSVTVIIPAGIHSQPTTNSEGPSPLIERWRSGGRCDCGGWDIGCPLSILDNQNWNKNASSEPDDDGFQISDMFIQGANKSTPALSLVIVHEGLYLLRFHAQLSALQAFSIGVAMLHSREPFMSAKETKTQESCSRSLHAPLAKQVRTLSQAISTPQDDIPIIVASNHDIFSVSCVLDPPLSPFGRV